ncbi:MAG TPA: carboxypeptidase-like regulatory domain-containing protein [Bdellovibrionota bacterium]|nr:carboxypeptidase-like regulatory domain-containing protein [Bdellovibrionota bacterium]
MKLNRSIFSVIPAMFLFSACSDDAPCDFTNQTGCDSGKVCEMTAGGSVGCFAPLVLRGDVFDLADQSAVADARVVALDGNGAGISTVAESDSLGGYELTVPAERDTSGAPASANITLRADASGYQTFPSGLRQPIPIDLSTAVDSGEGNWVVQSSLTDIGLIAQPGGTGTGSIHGIAEVPSNRPGTLVVSETGSPAVGTSAIADRDGNYKIFNLAAGSYAVRGFAKGANYDAGSVDLTDGQDAEVNLALNGEAAATLNGNVQIVNPGSGDATSIILVAESTFNSALVRGDAVPGLRAPDPGTDPNVSGAFTITGIPVGNYVVLAAFENDALVRDPDTCIAGTDILHQAFAAGESVDLSSGFKITGALDVISPGASGPEVVSGTPTFSWVDDSSEKSYHLTVLDSFGNKVWETDEAGHSGDDPSVPYGGTTVLESGMFYQFRVVSISNNDCELSQTEDLKGVFQIQ